MTEDEEESCQFSVPEISFGSENETSQLGSRENCPRVPYPTPPPLTPPPLTPPHTLSPHPTPQLCHTSFGAVYSPSSSSSSSSSPPSSSSSSSSSSYASSSPSSSSSSLYPIVLSPSLLPPLCSAGRRLWDRSYINLVSLTLCSQPLPHSQ